ncbi:hypothetical protein K501DRAFT_330964 [Backusella circina FSU 941]|nr:hypothetical protein K501DRAFT_330964 [Backusella circina FSU 941]
MEKELIFAQDFKSDTYTLVELSTPELVETFESGQNIVIKGLADDEAVLCTDAKTYIIKQANTSNSLVLLTSDDQYKIQDNLSWSIELSSCIARLGRLDELLKPTVYSGSQKESLHQDKTFYSEQDLLTIVQASEQELKQALRQRGVFEYNGKCRLFDSDYLLRLFDALMTNILIHGIPISQLTPNKAKECIVAEMASMDVDDIIPDAILSAALLNWVEDGVLDGDQLHLDDRKICRFLGDWLLTHPRDKKWEVQDFMEVWTKLGHDLFEPKLEMVSDMCIAEELAKGKSTQKYIQYYPVTELSTNPPQRFAALFSVKTLWTNDEITPFLVDLAPTVKERDSLLLKFTRRHKTSDKQILYGSRIK